MAVAMEFVVVILYLVAGMVAPRIERAQAKGWEWGRGEKGESGGGVQYVGRPALYGEGEEGEGRGEERPGKGESGWVRRVGKYVPVVRLFLR